MKSSLFSTILIALVMALPLSVDAARVWSDGAEQGLLGSGATNGFDAETGSPATSTAVVRSGNVSFLFDTTGTAKTLTKRVVSSDTSPIYYRMYMYCTAFPGSLTPIMRAQDSGGGNTYSIRLNSTGTLEFWDDLADTQSGSDSSALSLNTWYRIELGVNANPNGGSARLEGVEFASDAGADNGENHDRLVFGMMGSVTATCYIDDIGANDGTGSAQNSFPGEGRIVHAMPTGAGDNAADTGTCANAAERFPDDASSFFGLDSTNDIMDCEAEDSSTIGIDSYDTITLVQIGARIRREDTSGTATYNPRVKSASGGTVTSGTVTSITGTAVFRNFNNTAGQQQYRLTSYTDPTTGVAWTPTGTNSIDSMQIGATAPDATPDIHVTQLWALIEFVDGVDPTPPGGDTEDDTVFEIVHLVPVLRDEKIYG